MEDNTTIAAIATSVGSGGIGIVRISGPRAVPISQKIFKKTQNVSLETPLLSHRLYHGHIIDPRKNDRSIDEVLMTIMRSPHSYTREDVVEIQAHAGAVVLGAILQLVIENGARLAEPGEFTKRAFLNGRIDLTQAEAVIDVINARTDHSLQIASTQLDGGLKKETLRVHQRLLNLHVQMEAAIDFPDDVDEIIHPAETRRILRRDVVEPLLDLLRNYDEGHLLRDGVRLAILGRPNVGKSSLMNRLLEKDRAIVTDIPGTTRDSIEEVLNIKGLPVVLADTAGVHASDDPVEQLGIKRTREVVSDADLVLFMIDAGEGLTRADENVYELIGDQKIILVENKIDLAIFENENQIPKMWRLAARVKTSVRFGEGIQELKKKIFDTAVGQGDVSENKIVPNLRQKKLIEQTYHAATNAFNAIEQQVPTELIAIDLKEALDALNSILGIGTPEDVLNEIFNRFCIGK